MLSLIVKIMFCTLIIDISIGFAWVGLLGYRELRDTFNEVFPNAKERFKCWRNK